MTRLGNLSQKVGFGVVARRRNPLLSAHIVAKAGLPARRQERRRIKRSLTPVQELTANLEPPEKGN
jgi:hypothetical protein